MMIRSCEGAAEAIRDTLTSDEVGLAVITYPYHRCPSSLCSLSVIILLNNVTIMGANVFHIFSSFAFFTQFSMSLSSYLLNTSLKTNFYSYWCIDYMKPGMFERGVVILDSPSIPAMSPGIKALGGDLLPERIESLPILLFNPEKGT